MKVDYTEFVNSAFPIVADINGDLNISTGLTIRDYFAAKAMQTIIGRCYNDEQRHVAKLAYDMADEMLKAREI